MPVKNFSAIEKALRLETGSIQSGLDSEEDIEISIPELKVFTPEDHEQLIGNIKRDQKTASVEIFIKEARNKYGLEFEGKTEENLFNAFTKKVKGESTAEPNERITSLTTDNEALRGKYTALEGELLDVRNQFTQEREKQNINNILQTKLTAKGEFTVPTADAMTIFKSQHNFKMDEGSLVFLDNAGNVKKDNLENPVTVDHIIDQWSPTYLKPITGGDRKSVV